MKRGGGFVPGVKPGEETAGFIATILDRITLPGAVMLSLIAVSSYLGRCSIRYIATNRKLFVDA
ncbi:MAG: hypothetical protein RLZ73_1402 [Bacteroidota bacterium]